MQQYIHAAIYLLHSNDEIDELRTNSRQNNNIPLTNGVFLAWSSVREPILMGTGKFKFEGPFNGKAGA